MAKRRAFETTLTDSEEQSFNDWKTKYAPNDSGADYDLRGAFKAGLTPDKATGHWPDTFKKPNHPTFSPESIYHPQNAASPLSSVTAAPVTAGPPKTLDAAAQSRILGVTPSRPKTAAQRADQVAFDHTFGFDQPNATQLMAQREVRLKADPYDLDYGEKGTFGSGTHPVVAADKASRARGDGTVVQPEVRRATVAAAPAVVAAAAPAPASDVANVLSGIPKPAAFSADIANGPTAQRFGAVPLNTDLTSSDPAIARPPEPPGRAEMVGRTIRRVVGGVLGAIPRDTTFGSSHVTEPATPDEPIFNLPKAIAGFTRGVLGRQTEAGVSRSQVARIQQPTKENPVPVTDTTPAANIDDSKNAIQKFASDVAPDWNRRKMAFAGF
jgi:hypothetical protein